jgi:hypothetical protein
MAQPVVVSRVSPLGWVLFFLLGVFPLGLLGLLLRERYRVCRSCKARFVERPALNAPTSAAPRG